MLIAKYASLHGNAQAHPPMVASYLRFHAEVHADFSRACACEVVEGVIIGRDLCREIKNLENRRFTMICILENFLL